MELYSLDRNFQKVDVIDTYHSLIWTERYYGDSEIILTVPDTPEMISKLPLGLFLSIDESDEVMILETQDFNEEQIKFTGISLLTWLNNRFVRTSPKHEDRYWYISGGTPGWTLAHIVNSMCVAGSPYLNGTIDIGLINSEQLAIPNLVVSAYDNTGEVISVGVPYGPVYNALREIATTYEVGMQIVLDYITSSEYKLNFRNYKGLDRTSRQSQNSVVRFSAELDTFTNIKELQSVAILKTLMYAFAPTNPDGLAYQPGVSFLSNPARVGFDMRAGMVFAEDITTDMVGGDSGKLIDILNSRSRDALIANRWIAAIDGEVVPDNIYKYKQDYNLGDLVEVQGKTRTLQVARITEFIRIKDPTGERAYPTMTMLNSPTDIISPRPLPGPPPILPLPNGPVLYSLYYYDATFEDGPYPDDQNDYCHLAYADETGKDHFVDQNPNWDQGYAVWSPDYEKICYIQTNRRAVSSAVWPGSSDLTAPIPRQPADFPGTPSHGEVVNGSTGTYNTGETGIMNVYTNAIPTAGSGTVDIYLNASTDLTTGYKITVSRDVDTNWRIVFTDLNTATVIATTVGYSYLDFSDIGFTISSTGVLKMYWRSLIDSPVNWLWFTGLGTATPPLHSGTCVAIINNSDADAAWGGGLPLTIPKYSLVIQNKNGTDKTILRDDAFCYPNIVSYDNSMVAYGLCAGTNGMYNISDYRIVDADGSNDRSIFGSEEYGSNGESYPRQMQWTPDNKIALWWIKYDTSGGSPYPYTVNELRLYEPDGSGDYVVAWDAEAYRVANGIAQNDPVTDSRSWGPWVNGDVSPKGDYIIGWHGPMIATGIEAPGYEGYGVDYINDYLAVVIPCVENATPTFIKADDVSWKDWGLWKRNYQTGGFDSFPPSNDEQDTFTRADEQLDASANWESANPSFTTDDIQVVSNQLQPSTWNNATAAPLGALFTAAGSYSAATERQGVCAIVETPFTGAISTWPTDAPLGGPGVLFQNDKYNVTGPSPHSVVETYKGGYWLLIEKCPTTYYHNLGYIQVRIMRGSDTDPFNQLAVNSFILKPAELAISVYGHSVAGQLKIVVWSKAQGSSTFTQVMSYIDTSPLYTSGFCGVYMYGGTSPAWLDNYRIGLIDIPVPVYTEVVNVEPLNQPFWSPDGTEVLDHFEYAAPSWDFREWIALAFKPSDLSHRSFAFSPLDPADPNFTRYDLPSGDAWEAPDSTPPFARDSYIPTWFRTSIAMTAGYAYDPEADEDDPDTYVSQNGFVYIAYKKLDGTFGWLAIDNTEEQGYIAPYTGPAYLKGGYAAERMLITGISRQSYYEDEQLA